MTLLQSSLSRFTTIVQDVRALRKFRSQSTGPLWLPPTNRPRRAACILFVLACAAASDAAECAPAETKPPVPKMTVQEFDKVEVQQYPWGWIRWLMNSKIDPNAEMTFGVVYIKPQQKNPLHLHPKSAEYLHVLEGSCEHLVGKQWATLKAGDTVRIPKGVPHMARTTDKSCRAVIVYNTGKRQFVEVEKGKGSP